MNNEQNASLKKVQISDSFIFTAQNGVTSRPYVIPCYEGIRRLILTNKRKVLQILLKLLCLTLLFALQYPAGATYLVAVPFLKSAIISFPFFLTSHPFAFIFVTIKLKGLILLRHVLPVRHIGKFLQE